MTFTEAAVDVLRREGKPLHFRKIAEIAIRENLLDHVGKIPEETMADQLAAHCRLPRHERAIVVVQHGTFALAVKPGVKTSMHLDLEAGKRLEIDALSGAVVRFGAAKGVSTPVHQTIYVGLKMLDERVKLAVK